MPRRSSGLLGYSKSLSDYFTENENKSTIKFGIMYFYSVGGVATDVHFFSLGVSMTNKQIKSIIADYTSEPITVNVSRFKHIDLWGTDLEPAVEVGQLTDGVWGIGLTTEEGGIAKVLVGRSVGNTWVALTMRGKRIQRIGLTTTTYKKKDNAIRAALNLGFYDLGLS